VPKRRCRRGSRHDSTGRRQLARRWPTSWSPANDRTGVELRRPSYGEAPRASPSPGPDTASAETGSATHAGPGAHQHPDEPCDAEQRLAEGTVVFRSPSRTGTRR
jgi:hypothetical protein